MIFPMSSVIFDDYETLVEYNECGNLYSNTNVQTINAIFKNIYQNKIIFIVTALNGEGPSVITRMSTFGLFDKVFTLGEQGN